MHPERLRISPGVRASISADGLVLLDIRGGLLLASNPIGARIWQLLEAAQTREAIARQIATEFDVAIDRAARDVDAFVAALAERRLVEVAA